MSKNRLFWCLILTVAITAVIIGYLMYDEGLRERLVADHDKIKLGMSVAGVEKMLGKCDEIVSDGRGGSPRKLRSSSRYSGLFDHEKRGLEIEFENGKVVRISKFFTFVSRG